MCHVKTSILILFDAIRLTVEERLELLSYQKEGVKYALSRANTLIGDEPGLGKTLQAIGLINADPTIKSVIVITTASTKINWKLECEKWLSRPMNIFVGQSKDKELPLSNILILNFEAAVMQIKKGNLNRPFDLLIVDEAHNIKNLEAQRTKAVRQISAKRKLLLTGTAIVNNPADLFPLINLLDAGAFPNFEAFAHRYSRKIEFTRSTRWGEKKITMWKGGRNLEELHRILKRLCMIRRKKADVLTDLPQKQRKIVVLEHKNKLIHEKEFTGTVYDLDTDKAVFEKMANARYETALIKLPYVIDYIHNLIDDSPGYKVIVFAHHLDVIAALEKEFGKLAVSIKGSTPMVERQAAIDVFQNDKTVQVFIGSILAAGTGITLTAASHVIFAELDFVPGNMSQAEDRAHRIGQKNSVLVEHLVLDGSIDASIAKMLINKQAVIDRALDGV